MIRAMVLALALVAAISCKKKEEVKPAAPVAETKPAEAKPAEAPVAKPEPAAPAADGLGAVAIPNAKTTDPMVLTGGQPTDEQLAMAKAKGVKVVVNLRTDAEEKEGYPNEAKKVAELGLKYIHVPINGKTGDGLTEENAKKLAEVLAGADKPALVHCASGQRVGALFALKAFYVDKKTPEEALAAGHANGLSSPELEKIVQDKIAAAKKG